MIPKERTDLKRAGIVGMGSYLPQKQISNHDLEKIVDTSDQWITTRTGITFRRIASYEEAASDLGVEASRKALINAKIEIEDIDLIITSSSSPDMIFPSTACIIQSKLGAKKAAAFDIQAACSGFVYALAVAEQFILSGMYKNILVVGTEVLSKVVDWEDRNTCVLFGDGAGAVVVSEVAQGGILASVLGADGNGADLLSLPAGGSREPASADTINKRRHYIKMNGNEVFKFAVKILEQATYDVVNKASLTLKDVDFIIPHQANYRIIDAAIKRLNIDKEKMIINLNNYGNMSSASIPVALDEAYQAGKFKKGDKIVLVGFGAGLTWGANLLEWNYD